LDASECPPTFGCDPEMVQGIIAGGRKALYSSVESAEDNLNYGRQAVWDRGVQKKDVVIGIAASGSTPFVLGAVETAHSLGAKTVFLTFNPNSEFEIKSPRFLKISIATGPEVVTGSTRLKAGTATKLILNMFTTISMVRLGKVKSNLMIDLDPTCEKLHDRAARIYSALSRVPYNQAWKTLEENHWNLKPLLSKKKRHSNDI
jgi:N-acetylmuramic acid 6-phosphate etherase